MNKDTQSDFLCFRPSPIHGNGGFACCDIAVGTRIVEYAGERITKHESLRRCELGNAFLFALDDEYDLDGNVEWNPARFLNHSCAPNSEAQRDEHGRIWIVALRAIGAGEEVTFNYGYDLEDYREHPCQCGAPACAGFIVDEALREWVRGRRGTVR